MEKIAIDLLFKKMSEEESLTKRLFNATSAEKVQEIAADYGVVLTIEEIIEARGLLENAIIEAVNDELSEIDLEKISAGALTVDPKTEMLRQLSYKMVSAMGKEGQNTFKGW